jgi:anti-sigma regulatory factor (Ser/Thr protein kinase)
MVGTFSGWAHLVGGGSITTPTDNHHPENETSALHQFHRMNWGGSTPMVQLIRRHLPSLGHDQEDILRTCYSEIAQNIDDHARSPIGGIICARYFSRSREIRIAVADLGDGIGEVLRRAKPKTGIEVGTDAHALELVLGGGVSSKSRPNNMGQGISNLAAMARGHGGKLQIFSGNAHAMVRSSATKVVLEANCRFPGTLVLLALQVDSEVTSNDSEHE